MEPQDVITRQNMDKYIKLFADLEVKREELITMTNQLSTHKVS